MHSSSRAFLTSTFAVYLLDLCAAQSCSGTTSVTRAPSGCRTWTGDIVIPTDTTDDVSLDGLEEIQGSLNVHNVTGPNSLTSDSLHTVAETLSIKQTLTISTIDFPELSVIGDLELSGLPVMQANSLLQTLTSLSSLLIENTGIQELEGFSLETMDFIRIVNNNYLDSINFQPYNITGAIEITANGRNVEVSMPNVQIAQNMTFANCSRISMPSLQQSFSLSLTGNFISEFNGAPLLREVDGGLSFVNNAELARIALPELRTVAGGFEVVNNSKLEALDELYSLESISGAIEFEGPLENVTFQSLNRVLGSFSINSTRDLPCDRFDELYTDGLINGFYECTTASDASDSSTLSIASTADDGGGSTSNSNSDTGNTSQQQSQGLSTGARIGIGLGLGLGVGTLVGGLVGYCFHLRAKARKNKEPQASEHGVAEKDGSEVDRGFMLGNDVQKHEMEQPMGEMGSGGEAQELPAKHGLMELDGSASTKGPAGIESRHEMPADQVPLEKGEKDKKDEK